jgi:hypothetical protein
MENNTQFYFDLGENPWTPTQKKIFNALYALLLLAILFNAYRKFQAHGNLDKQIYSLLFFLNTILLIYNVNRKRIAPIGHYFVDLGEGMLKYRGLGDTKIESFALKDIDYIYKDGRKIGFKPSNSHWNYIKVGSNVDAIYTQLENLTEQPEPKSEIVIPVRSM